MNTNQLYLEYARVIKMCEGTVFEDKPWECVKIEVFDGVHKTPNNAVDMCQNFYNNKKAIFAVAILEDKQVWVGSEIYDKHDGTKWKILMQQNDGSILAECDNDSNFELDEISDDFSWNPVKPNKKFKLKGCKLPRPVNLMRSNYSCSIGGKTYYFRSFRDGETVCKYLTEQFDKARDK